MRVLRLVLSAVLFAALPAMAHDVPTITTASPATIHAQSGEWFLTIQGSHFLPSAGVQVVFSGPAGTITLLPNKMTDSQIVVWVPSRVILNAGSYSVRVRVPSGTTTADSNPLTFHVVGDILYLQIPPMILAEAINSLGDPVEFRVTAESMWGDPTYVDCDHKSGETFPLDVTTKVTCTATDDFGNATRDTFEIQVNDTTPPSISAPVDLKVFGKPEGSYVAFDTKTFDLVDGDLRADCKPATDTFFTIGTTTVACSAMDKHRNTATATFRVHVGDDNTPVLTVPVAVRAEATSSLGAVVDYKIDAVDVKGNAVDTRCSTPAGSQFAIGVTTVKCTAFGANGKTANEAFDVTVADSTAPEISAPRDFSVQAPAPEGAYVRFTVSAKDVVDGAADVSCYPLSGSLFAPGDTTVSCTATDKSKNTGTASFVVTVIPFFDDTNYSKTPENTPDM